MKRAATVSTMAAVFVCILFLSAVIAAEPVWQPLIDRLSEDGFDRQRVTSLFTSPDLKFNSGIMARKMNVLLNSRLSKQESGSPKEPKVMNQYLNPLLIAGAYAFYREHRADFVLVRERYGVSGEVLTAILLVETRLGLSTGDHNAFSILASMALAKDFSLIKGQITRTDISQKNRTWLIERTGQKGDWAYAELKALMRYAQGLGQDPLSISSSVYGAIGLCQFMPTSVEHYGRDGSGDGRIDMFNEDDALHSIANYLASHGWRESLSREEKLKIIYHYNHSESYALTIMAIADRIAKARKMFGE